MAKDLYANPAYIQVVEGAANTLTFKELNIAVELTKKHSMVIHRIEYQLPTTTIVELAGAADSLFMGLSLTDSITDVGLDQVEVFDREVLNFDSIAALGGQVFVNPKDKRFTDMPGGGLLLPVKKIYGFCKGVSLANPTTVNIRFWYTIREMSADEYLQLVEAYNILK